MELRTIDLFAGIGGIRLGFHRACLKAGVSHQCVFSSEIAPHACEIYRKNFGDDPSCDITAVEPSSVPDFDVALAGFPCQAFSIAGRKEGFDDARGTLFFNLAKIIEAKKPRAFLFENVKNLIHHDKGRTLARIVDILSSLGYNVSWRMLNSKNYGVPQNRPRVYIVGFLGFGGGFEWPKPTDKSKRLRDILEKGADPKYFVSEKYWSWMKAYRAKQLAKGNQFGYVIRKPDGVSATILCGGMGKERNLVVDTPPAIPQDGANVDGVRCMTPLEWERLQGFPEVEEKLVVCLGHQKSYVNAEEKSLTLPILVGNAEREGKKGNAKYAGELSFSKFQDTNRPVPSDVLISCAGGEVQVLNHGKLSLFVSIAAEKNWSLPSMRKDDFVRHVAGLFSIEEIITSNGEEGSRQSGLSLMDYQNGGLFVRLSGDGIMRLVGDVVSDSTIKPSLMNAIMSNHLNSRSSGLMWIMSFCSVLSAINGFIPPRTSLENGLVIEFIRKRGWTTMVSDTARMDLLGNSVTVNVIEAVAGSMLEEMASPMYMGASLFD